MAPPVCRAERGKSSKVNEMIGRSEEHTSDLQSRVDLVCRLLLEKKTGAAAVHIAGDLAAARPAPAAGGALHHRAPQGRTMWDRAQYASPNAGRHQLAAAGDNVAR